MPIATHLGDLLLEAAPSLRPLDAEGFEPLYRAIRGSLGSFGPEIIIVLFALGVLIADLLIPRRLSRHLAWPALLGCALPFLALPSTSADGESLFLGMAASDPFSSFFKGFFLLGSAVTILMSYSADRLAGRRMGEYYFLILVATFGGMLMASSTHFLMMFLSLEILSISSYALVGFFRSDLRSAEASLKYVIFGAVASAVMAYGFSLWFGLTGSGELSRLAAVVAMDASVVDAPGMVVGDGAAGSAVAGSALELRAVLTIVFALLAIFVGIAFKVSAVPMHFWTPDVYEGAPTPVTAFLSVVSKGAGFALALRFFGSLSACVGALDEGSALASLWRRVDWTAILALVAVATMTIGNFAALWQTNVKRLFAYSSIAHAGYILLGLTLLRAGAGDAGLHDGLATAGFGSAGLQTVGFYLAAYLTMNLGAFAVIVLVENRTGSAELDGYRGLSRKAPFLALSLAAFLFSLIGVPPTAGFMGKFQLFLGVIGLGSSLKAAGAADWWMYYALVFIAVANTAVSAYYYLRIAKTMYFDGEPSSPAEDRGAPGARRGESLWGPALAGRVVIVAMLFLTFYLFLRAEAILSTTLNLRIHV